MKLVANIGNRDALARQAQVTRALGSAFVADVLEAGQRQLGRAPRTAALIAAWPGDPSAAALGMRFNAALNALARRGTPPALRSLYRGEHGDFDGAIGTAMALEDRFIASWMRDTPQTNEVARAAGFFAALMLLQRRFGLPFELLEIGSSAGLNLNMAHYAYVLGGQRAGAPGSPVLIAPQWRGPAPAIAPVEVVSARGADLRPLDPADPATAERLMSFVWADQPGRALRLDQALRLARRVPPMVDRLDAQAWLNRHLEANQPNGHCRVVFHSMVLQYLTAADREAVIATIRAAGARATAERPLAWLGLEWTPARNEVRLTMTCWPEGEAYHLATCHPYGDWIEWHG